jgi:hypothetical protein
LSLAGTNEFQKSLKGSRRKMKAQPAGWRNSKQPPVAERLAQTPLPHGL